MVLGFILSMCLIYRSSFLFFSPAMFAICKASVYDSASE